MKRKLRMSQSNIIAGVIFLITMFVACSPLFTENCINGHDVEYHLLRIESLKEGILMGKPFLKVNVLFLGGAGYASSMFYPDFLLYFPALLRVMGVSINASYHLFIALCFVLCYGLTYYSTRYITKNSYAATIAAVVLTLCEYHIDDVYTRSAVGEYTAFIFVPLVICGLYDLIYEDMKKPWILGAGYAGVLLCHTNTCLMCILMGGLLCLYKYKVFKNSKLLLKAFVTVVVTILLTMFYWLPMVEQMYSATFHFSTAWISPAEAMREVSSVFYGVFPAVGICLFMINLPRLMLAAKQEYKDLLEFSTILLIFGILFALAATRLFPWERLGPYLEMIQFPWRMYLMASVCLAVSGAITLCLYFREEKVREYTLLIVICMMIVSAFSYMERTEEGYYSYSNDYFAYEPFTFNIIGGEWLPETVKDVEAIEKTNDKAMTDQGKELLIYRRKNSMTVEYPQQLCTYVDVPMVYYKGYAASSLAADGGRTPLIVTGDGNNGYCRVMIPQGMKAQQLDVYYKGTVLQMISYIVSTLTLIGIIGIFVMRSRKLAGTQTEQKEDVGEQQEERA